ncbi:MAG TPA: hypothetical protein VFB60_12470 [Ktedonobacteraceae bacterium]|nr:hypothetical protein [Ktedonobacteraceae bacterium]
MADMMGPRASTSWYVYLLSKRALLRYAVAQGHTMPFFREPTVKPPC